MEISICFATLIVYYTTFVLCHLQYLQTIHPARDAYQMKKRSLQQAMQFKTNYQISMRHVTKIA